ncbi:hypothetical protein [Streptomyces sp. CA-111067]|uniref:hypothetical protein n=1 Tax=Streptomyces sp. CA-111067 TaxID=3240046 RepID=UPI003D9832EB
MSAAVQPKPRTGPTPMRTLLTLGTLTVSLVGAANKTRRSNGSTDYVDHVDVIASWTAFFVLAVRAGRRRKTPAS